MNKIIRNGKVAVLVSPGYGAGWSTWNAAIPECLFDPDIVRMVEAGKDASEIEARAKAKWSNGYWGGADGLTVQWITQGELFKVQEYDGSESVLMCGGDGWIVA